MTASSFTDQRGLLAGRPVQAPSTEQVSTGSADRDRARAAGSRRRWPTRRTTVGQRAAGVLMSVACVLGCCWYVQQITSADRGLITGSVTSSGVVDLNFGSAGMVASVLVHVGEHVREHQLLATEAAPGAVAIELADVSAVTADREQVAAEAGTAAGAADARAQLARDQARLAADRETIAQTRIVAPAAGTVTAVDAQPGQNAAPAGIRDYVGQGQAAPLAAPPLFSLLPESPQVSSRSGVAESATLPVIQLLTSHRWEVLVLVPENSAAAVRAGQAVRVSVPADGLTAVPGSVQEVLATPVTTAEGDMYEAIVTVASHWSDPPLDGMTANVMLVHKAGR